MELLREPVWQFIGALAAIFGIFIAVAIYRAEQAREDRRAVKQLSYEVVANTPLFNVVGDIKPRIEVRLDGNPVEDVHYVMISFSNSGNIVIEKSDQDPDISIGISFGDGAQIIEADIVQAQPPDLPVKLRVETNKVTLDPLLLNPGDSIVFKALVSQFEGNLDSIGPISDIKSIERVEETETPTDQQGSPFAAIPVDLRPEVSNRVHPVRKTALSVPWIVHCFQPSPGVWLQYWLQYLLV